MRIAVRLVFLGIISSSLFLKAQLLQPPVPLQLNGEPRPTQLPPGATIGSPQCDSSGQVYVRYATSANGSLQSNVARIEADGSTQTISLAPLPGAQNDGHIFIFAVDNDGSLHEIARVADDPDQPDVSGHVEYMRFDSDGDLRSQSAFADDFIPSSFLPLPNGDFFAAGITLEPASDGVSENPVGGIFSPDAQLQRHLHSGFSSGGAKDGDGSTSCQTVRLGDDGDLYLLTTADHATVEVVNQAGRIIRKLELHEPFETDVASDMWVSGNRLLVVYEGEADKIEDSHVYMLYDAQSGELIRAYKPNFVGSIACFQDGESLSVLVRDATAGTVSIGTADLQ